MMPPAHRISIFPDAETAAKELAAKEEAEKQIKEFEKSCNC